MKKQGYFKESERHSLNARGVKTRFKQVKACKTCPYQSKKIILMRLYDDYGNKSTLVVRQTLDGTLNYSYFQSWEESGLALSLKNLQPKVPLPEKNKHNTVGMLLEEIKDSIRYKNYENITTYGL